MQPRSLNWTSRGQVSNPLRGWGWRTLKVEISGQFGLWKSVDLSKGVVNLEASPGRSQRALTCQRTPFWGDPLPPGPVYAASSEFGGAPANREGVPVVTEVILLDLSAPTHLLGSRGEAAGSAWVSGTHHPGPDVAAP